jgi:mono/diheme cytochrome c family protein
MDGWNLMARRTHVLILTVIVLSALLAATGSAVVIALGIYNIGADAPHTPPIYAVMQLVRNRSIAVRAHDLAVPKDLSEIKRISTGAGLYAEMCSGCHLAPGMEKTEMSQGLYPQAPELARGLKISAKEEFWAVKHGIKMTAMPAWGRTHNDELIWDMVAFVQKLPTLSQEEYQAAVKSAPADHDEMMKDMGMKGMPMKPSGKAEP